ncbi:LysR family transcriptional regulator [Streptomyces triculaminicus]|uniref:LysR family transcriptional regulator n=2 Tax=Streptomyces TaxID=1883 RepID=A0A939FK14_9ACTN|nr:MULTISPECIES: LysR family transcriptional regulator [Streptomyces]MBO0651442.1 LysR family transcriptional regulator [Streptomyces triculaminicus]QSY47567.1 LysR family transcriptional regulator [Streptomyces griseocarneus]
MDIRQLAAFHKVATLLSFTRAAAELKYAQSSVTGQIKRLENSLGVSLFERLPGGVVLAPAGQRLLPYAERMLSLAEEARTATAGAGLVSGTLTVGTTESVISYRMPPLLEFFHRRYPRLEVVLRPTPCAETLRAVRQGTLDAGFLPAPRGEHPGLRATVLGPAPLLLVAPPSHPLAAVRPVTTKDLARVPVLAPEESGGYRELFETAVRRVRGGPAGVLGFGTIESTKRGMRAGLGVGLLPAVAVADEIAAGSLVALDWTPPFEVFTQIVWRRGRQMPAELRTFIDRSVEFMAEDSGGNESGNPMSTAA